MKSSPRRAASGRAHSPTRETLLRYIEQHARPISIAALAAATGWHNNTVRGHIYALWHDGYLTRERDAHHSRGRPSWVWRPTPRTPAEPYAALAAVLAAALENTSSNPEQASREAGREWGRALATNAPRAASNAAAQQRLVDAMRDQGFAPCAASGAHAADADAGTDAGTRRGENREAGPTALTLRQCPLIEAAGRHPDVVCAVHRGLIEGFLESVAPDGAAPLNVRLLPFSAPGECALQVEAAA